MIGNIYKIEFNEYTYIGSTTNIKDRQLIHNRRLKNNTILLYKTARECNIKKIECILIEEVEVEARLDLRKIEQNYINKYEPNLNSNGAYRTDDDLKLYKKKWGKIYYDKNKEIMKEYQQIYNHKNKEIINQKSSEKISCSICNKLLNRSSINRHIKKLH